MNLPLLGTFAPNFNFGDVRAFWDIFSLKKGGKFFGRTGIQISSRGYGVLSKTYSYGPYQMNATPLY